MQLDCDGRWIDFVSFLVTTDLLKKRCTERISCVTLFDIPLVFGMRVVLEKML